MLDRLLEAGLGNHVRLSLLADNGWLVQLECPTLCVYIHPITNIGNFLQCRKKGVKCEYSPYSPELRQKAAFLGEEKVCIFEYRCDDWGIFFMLDIPRFPFGNVYLFYYKRDPRDGNFIER